MHRADIKNLTAFKRDAAPFFSALGFGLAAHMYMLTNKIPVDDDICNFFTKGATTVSGRYGLELMRFIMPDVSMPWIYGLMTLLLLALCVCVTVRLFDIKSRLMQAALAGLIVCFPAETGTMSYMFTCAPYAVSMLAAVCAVYVYSRGCRWRMVISPLLLIFSCSIYQGYFAFAASFCVLLMIKKLLEGDMTAREVLIDGLRMLLMLALAAAIYGVSVYVAGRIAGIPVLDAANKRQGLLMRVAVAYSAYLHTLFSGYFAYVNGTLSLLMHLLMLLVTAVGIVLRMRKGADVGRIALLGLCLFLLPLSSYCLYLLADNGYIHSLALYPFASVYVLAALVIDGFMPQKTDALRFTALGAMAAVIVCNIYFANGFYLYSELQYSSRTAFYTTMLTRVMQTEGFNEHSRLAIIGDEAALDFPLETEFDFAQFQLPGNNIMNPIHAKDIINNYLGADLAFAGEEECCEIMQTQTFADMPVYPYQGSVAMIGDTVTVKLSLTGNT